MAISEEQLAALRPGDIVQLTDDRYPGVTLSGPLTMDDDRERRLYLGWTQIRDRGQEQDYHRTITVITPAPPDLYVNSDRTSPVDGDVVRGQFDTTNPADAKLWMRQGGKWVDETGTAEKSSNPLPAKLVLLVDGMGSTAVPA